MIVSRKGREMPYLIRIKLANKIQCHIHKR
uniref:Uncharacterized protein n=1 Tax=Caudovirales sp. ct7oE3 TaxID=2826768 RepID=A0A8S5M025_9CAUD|nr:MAG TPA: hypothetical protein [Caudovirales sp. ct7oE3]